MGELVSIGDSQMLRSLRKLKNQEINESIIAELFLERKRIQRKRCTPENIQRLIEIDKQIDDYLFVPEIISVYVDNIKYYKHIGKNGFFVNGVRFVRFMCGAGQARRNSSLWVSEQYEKPLKAILNNDRKDIEIAPAKFNAYFALAGSATLEVSTPYFVVVPDCKILRTERVEFIKEVESDDDVVEEQNMEIEFNLWDGQGLISPKFAQQWADELELDYIPSAFIVRSNFIKGMLCTFDFHTYAEEVACEHFVTDIWGNKYNIRDADIILTESQFKLWNAFDSLDDFVKKCKKNRLGWGVSRVTPKKENTHTFLNYQFIQVLNLNDEQIKELCQPTIEFIENVVKNKIEYTLLYLLGETANQDYDASIYNKIHDSITKALILNNKLLDDPYIKNYLIHSLNKKIREAYIGNLVVEGQYTMIVADPYAFCEYMFGKPIKGLLDRGEHYNRYWLDKGEKRIAAMRAPLTWISEVNILNLVQNRETNNWFRHLNNCVIYSVFGVDNLLQSGSDQDGDVICLTNNRQVIEGAQGGLPIHYNNKKTPKQKIIEEELYSFDVKGFDNRVGYVTNVATSGFCLSEKLKKGSPEYNETIKRLKCFRKEQGSTIDATKGLEIKPFPVHWTKWIRIPENASREEKERIEFLNRIAINRRVYFMRYIYPSYNRNYLEYRKKYSKDCEMRFDKTLDELMNQRNENETLIDEEIRFLENFDHYNPLMETPCLMNKIAWYMEARVKQLKISLHQEVSEEHIMSLKNKNIGTDKSKYKKLYDLYREYKSGKRNFASADRDDDTKFKTIGQYNKYIRQKANEISSDGSELANLAIDICYITHPKDNKNFVWQIFGNELVENILQNKQNECCVPFLNKKGDISYLGEKYSMRQIEIDNNLEISFYEDFE